MTDRTAFLPDVTPTTAPYWEAANEGRLLLQECGACDSPIFYPRELCPHCFSSDLGWREASGEGEIFGYSVLHQSPIPAYEGDTPYVIAVVELAEGPRMFTNIVNCDPSAVSVGAPVMVTFERRDGQALPQFGLAE